MASARVLVLIGLLACGPAAPSAVPVPSEIPRTTTPEKKIGSVKKEDVETTSMDQLTKVVGRECPPIVCPGDLPGFTGSMMTCAVTLPSGVHDVYVKVSSVADGKAHFDIDVAEKPRP